MLKDQIPRKSLDNEEYMRLREVTQKVSDELSKRLKRHLLLLQPLFTARKLLGTYVKSSRDEEVTGADNAFAELRGQYSAFSKKAFGSPAKLQPPLPPISNKLEATPFEYQVGFEGSEDQRVSIACSCSWTLCYQSEFSLGRLKAMISGAEPRQTEEIKQSVVHHLILAIFFDRFPALSQLLEDLRYQVELRELSDLAGLRVVRLKAPIQSFLPPDEFIRQVTQLSGIPAFQDIIDLDAIKNISDPLRESLENIIT